MRKQILWFILAVWLAIALSSYSLVSAASDTAAQQVKDTLPNVEAAITAVKDQDIVGAEQAFQDFKDQWVQVKNDVRSDSLSANGKIETKMAAVSIALLNQDATKAEEALQSLHNVLSQYAEGQIGEESGASSKVNLAAYVKLLQSVKQTLEEKDFAKAKADAEELTSQWLSVEGEVVGKSQSAYNNAEKSLVLLSSYIANADQAKKAIDVLDGMIQDLEPLANTSYSMWDAALIPIREGLEALLVIGALLTFTKKGGSVQGGRWVWGGTIAGILASLAIGFVVTYLLSTAAFGQNNFLINGWSGVIASLMLLYVSYWLHRNSNVKKWNTFLSEKTAQALTKGRMISFAVLAFLAILREGIETVLFLVGMANQMSAGELTTGIGVGFGILIIIGILMLKLSVRLPLKPFFLFSSMIVLYLCIKFMGSGIHSLQLSGLIPATANSYIPTIDLFGVYPSWYSTLPQLIIVLLAISVLLVKQLKQAKQTNFTQGA